MHKLKLFLLISGLVGLAGCASVPNVPLQKKFWQEHKQKVDIAASKSKPATLYHTGREGLIDIAINDMVTNKFQNYLRVYPVKTVTDIKWTFLKKLKKHNINANIYNHPINIEKLANYSGDKKKFAVKDYTSFAAKIGKHKLLVISVNRVGASRDYYGFIPLGAPEAVCDLTGRLVDVRNNHILWRYATHEILAVQGKWDQPPNYPSFTKTLKRAVVIAQQDLLENFFTIEEKCHDK